MSSATAGIYFAISPPLSGAMEDCSIVRVQQLQMLYRRRCCMFASQRMFGSLVFFSMCILTVWFHLPTLKI